MSEIIRFDCKIRINKRGQIQVTIPKALSGRFRPDQPVTVAVYRRKIYQMQLKKEGTNEKGKKI